MQEEEPDSFPRELNALLERKFLFKVKISNYNLTQNWPVFTVVKMSDSKQLIKAFQEASPTVQV